MGLTHQLCGKNVKEHEAKTIAFNYNNEELVDIINYLAGKKGVNILLPNASGDEAIKTKVTLYLKDKLTLDQAWAMLYTILDIAGYTMMPRQGMYAIVKNTATITKEPLPLYIGMPPQQLPDTDQRIRYVYYLANIKPTDDEATSETVAILKNLLPADTSSYKIDTTTNAIIITAKADDIKSVMSIIVDLDKVDFQETFEVFKLRYTVAQTVADLFNNSILKTAASDLNRYHLSTKQQSEVSFFSKHIRIVPQNRTNALILIGRPQAIERTKDFILKYIDIELDAGQSVLHVYKLQYLDAPSLATVLTNIINTAKAGGTGQSSSGGTVLGGTFKNFDEILIRSDKPAKGDYGGNKLIVAARNDDWKVLEKLIAELDIPQPQVLLEVLIADLSLADSRFIGNLLRNAENLALPGGVNVQTAQIGGVTLDNLDSSGAPTLATTLQSDLLTLEPQGFLPGGASWAKKISTVESGSAFLSFNDDNGKTWSLLQILKTLDSTKILSHPHVLAINNQPAKVVIGETRLLPDEAVAAGGTTTTRKFKSIPANLKVTVTPRISSGNTVNLGIVVESSNFKSASNADNTIITRNVTTNAEVLDKHILALGGLIKVDTLQTAKETPILSKIPILGYFFKSRGTDIAKTNLTIFISPTIIQPRLRSGVSDYTKDYIRLAKEYANEGSLFDSLQDPITRYFFKTGNADSDYMIDEFLDKDEFKRDLAKESPAEIQKKLVKKPIKSLVVKNDHDHKKVSKDASLEQFKALIANDSNPLLHV